MSEPSTDEKERLAAKAQWIADALGGTKANGHGNGANGSTAGLTEDELDTPATVGMLLQAYKELTARLRALEARPAMSYRGVFDDQKVYQRGDVVTSDGSAWACLEANCGVRPGSSDTAWRLMVKRGRDGKDGSRK